MIRLSNHQGRSLWFLKKCSKQETWTSNHLNSEDQWVVMVFLHSQYQNGKRKIFKLSVGPHRWDSRANGGF